MGSKERKHSKSESDPPFETLVTGVKPIVTRSRHTGTSTSKVTARTRAKAAATKMPAALPTDSEFVVTEPGEELVFRRDSVSMSIMRDLKRGKIPRRDALDLHGMTSTEAQDKLREFIGNARSRGFRCIHIVHGKGYRSGNRGAVLKTKVNHWLREWQDILAFCSARPEEGGTGAVYVLLKTR